MIPPATLAVAPAPAWKLPWPVSFLRLNSFNKSGRYKRYPTGPNSFLNPPFGSNLLKNPDLFVVSSTPSAIAFLPAPPLKKFFILSAKGKAPSAIVPGSAIVDNILLGFQIIVVLILYHNQDY